MARPRKAGLTYFYKDVHDWDDLKIIDLVTRFGPSGFAVYDVVLCEIYKNGYYLETPIEKLALFVIRAIGSKWIKDKTFVLQVILLKSSCTTPKSLRGTKRINPNTGCSGSRKKTIPQRL